MMAGSDAAGRVRVDFILLAVILAGLAGLMGSLIARTHQMAVTLRCQQQLQQIVAAVQNYALSYAGHPPDGDWRARLDVLITADEPSRGAGPSGAWTCPAGGGYVGNRAVLGTPGRALGAYMLRQEIGLVADGAGSPGTGLGDAGSIAWRHRGGANAAFLDGHVEWVSEQMAGPLKRHWDGPQ